MLHTQINSVCCILLFMGKEHKHSRRNQRKHRSTTPPKQHFSNDRQAVKLLKYASLGKTHKLRALLDKQLAHELLNTTRDSEGRSALHQAARHGRLEVVRLLLRRKADAGAADAAGNTPGHLAAMHGHWLVLTELIKTSNINVDIPNEAGLTIRHITQQQQQQQNGQHAPNPAAVASESGNSSSPGTGGSSSDGQAGRHGNAAKEALDDLDANADWEEKLAYEMGCEEGGCWPRAWGGAWQAAAAAASTEAAGRGRKRRKRRQATSGDEEEEEDDDDDAWADRLWHDMQEHRRNTTKAAEAARAANSRGGFTQRLSPGPNREEAAQERERRAKAAAAESARILQEEQAKDADWRAAMMRQIEEASLPLRRSTYEQHWSQLESWPAGKTISFQDVPWPCPLPASQAAVKRQQQQPQQQQVLKLDPQHLRTLILAGASGPADVKLALRRELMRWHPDKFTARYGSRLADADKAAIHAGVHAVAQQLTALKQQ